MLGAVAIVIVVVAMSRLGVDHPVAYVVPGVVLWWCLHEAGVEPTLAGVVLGLLTPARPRRGVPVLERLEDALHPISSFVIVPLFALANAGVALGGDAIEHALASPVTIGIVVGLVVGKFVGILGASTLALRAGVGALPDGVDLRHVAGIAVLAGIGFTVSLFISDLAFRGVEIDDAKIGVLAASAVAAVLGMIVLRVLLRGPVPKLTEDSTWRHEVVRVRIVAITSDLMDRSRISGAVDGVEFARDAAASAGADVVLIDLARDAALVAAVRAAAPAARIVAFGPHVDTELLEQATRDGADAVLPRSKFFQDPAAASR